jgi:hypothetical protein
VEKLVNKRKTAALLRDAAWRVEKGKQEFSCLAIDKAVMARGGATMTAYWDWPEVAAYAGLYVGGLDSADTKCGLLLNLFGFTQTGLARQSHRVLALCFAAAIIEAGDAP